MAKMTHCVKIAGVVNQIVDGQMTDVSHASI